MTKLFSKIEKIFEDENLLAVNKPAGLLCHGDGKREVDTVTDWIIQNYPELENVGEDIKTSTGKIIKKSGLCHRLDRDTSGLLLIAKNQETYLHIKKQFQDRKIKKVYKAFVYGEVVFDQKEIKTPYGRCKKDFRKFCCIERNIRGEKKEAITKYKKIFTKDNFSFLELFPQSGRTHQIRVHLKYDNHPVLADSLYAGKKYDKENPEKNLFFTRQALHCFEMTFQIFDSQDFTLQAPLPEDFKKAEKILLTF